MEMVRPSPVKYWLGYTLIVLILAMVPSSIFVRVFPTHLALNAISPFWQYISWPVDEGLGIALRPVILLATLAISTPSLLFAWRRYSAAETDSILTQGVVLGVFVVLINVGLVSLSQFVLFMPYISYREWSNLTQFSSLVLVFLIVVPTIRWEVKRCLTNDETAAHIPETSRAVSVSQSPCSPSFVGKAMFYSAVIGPFVYESFGGLPSLILGGMFYTISFGSVSISFEVLPSFFVPLYFISQALGLVYANGVWNCSRGAGNRRRTVVIGLVSLVPAALAFPIHITGVLPLFGPVPLLFLLGLLFMFLCEVRGQMRIPPKSNDEKMPEQKIGSEEPRTEPHS
jgi:hypothetical protein